MLEPGKNGKPLDMNRCARCGRVGNDRRTLLHAAGYDMEELGIPFYNVILFHADHDTLTVTREPESVGDIVIQSARCISSGELVPHLFHALRSCKDCRRDWLQMIEAWWGDPILKRIREAR